MPRSPRLRICCPNTERFRERYVTDFVPDPGARSAAGGGALDLSLLRAAARAQSVFLAGRGDERSGRQEGPVARRISQLRRQPRVAVVVPPRDPAAAQLCDRARLPLSRAVVPDDRRV